MESLVALAHAGADGDARTTRQDQTTSIEADNRAHSCSSELQSNGRAQHLRSSAAATIDRAHLIGVEASLHQQIRVVRLWAERWCHASCRAVAAIRSDLIPPQPVPDVRVAAVEVDWSESEKRVRLEPVDEVRLPNQSRLPESARTSKKRLNSGATACVRRPTQSDRRAADCVISH